MNHTITFVQGKTGASVQIPIHQNLYEYLLEFPRSDRPKKPVFPKLFDKPGAGKSGLSMSFKRLMKRAGIDDGVARKKDGKLGRNVSRLSFHSLRHSFNSAMANADVPLEIRQKLTGHASKDMNKQYTHLELETVRRAVESISRLPGKAWRALTKEPITPNPWAVGSTRALCTRGPELLVDTARAILFVKRPLASTHLEFYLKGGGKDFVEDNNIKDWITRDSGIRNRLKREIFPHGAKPKDARGVLLQPGEYAKDEAGQDFRFAFGSIDKVDFEVDLADHLVRVWFKDRYEWHPFYPKLYPPKPGDAARDDNCVHAAMVEMQDRGAADYWMQGVAEVPLSLIAGP